MFGVEVVSLGLYVFNLIFSDQLMQFPFTGYLMAFRVVVDSLFGEGQFFGELVAPVEVVGSGALVLVFSPPSLVENPSL